MINAILIYAAIIIIVSGSALMIGAIWSEYLAYKSTRTNDTIFHSGCCTLIAGYVCVLLAFAI